MTQPETGADWSAGGFNDTDNRFAIRGPLVGVLVRDYRGAATDISPHVFNPLAKDGKLRADLFAQRKVGGNWINSTEGNEGWLFIGANTKKGGPEREPKVDVSPLEILQSYYPIEKDITKIEKTVKFTPIETLKPVIKRLRNNLPLQDEDGNLLVEDAGQEDYFVGTPLEADFVPRQLLLVRARQRAGGKLFTIEPIPLCKLTSIGAAKMDMEDADAAELEFSLEPDPFFLIPDPRNPSVLIPGLDGEWVGGKGWTTIGGVPVVGTTPPVATAGTAGKASFVFAAPTGPGDPFEITAESTVDDGITWLEAVLDTPNAVTSAGGNTTVKVKSVAAGATKFRAKVKGTNGAVVYTPKSAAVTVL
ncbi:hypothetical protein [Mycobacteroides abscessus]|uniref:hypothetical protein n=1 Tax=Mycobacteroides abscessus TaxID=36809 RepID=UPI0007F97469|nr:hypothetical protein [Mycobacteroides abscessus]ANN98202.1 hypothetical protein BAB74_05190 [Mycobacteroides abscessus]